MAKKNRVDLNAVIQANLPDNNTDFITPALDREVEIDEVDSCFNLEDDTATDVNYTPSTPAEWNPEGAPTEVKGGLDILAARTGTNPSNDIAYVSDSGNDTIAQVGNPLKPFATFNVALNALPSSNCVLKALGGTYTEDIILNLSTSKSKFALILEGVTINGRISISSTNSDICIFLNGSTITSNTTLSTLQISCLTGNNFIYGGTVINTNGTGSCLGGSNSGVKNVIGTKFEGQNNCCFNCFTFNFVKCNFSSQSICIFRTNNSEFYDCNIISATNNAFRSQNTSCKLYNCFIQGGNNGIQGENSLIGYFNNCRIEGLSGSSMTIGSTPNELFFKDCDLIGSTDCITYINNISRLATTNHIFQNCKMYAGTGNIFNEGTYAAGDLGNTQVINCIYNKSFTPGVAPQKIFEYNKTEIIGLQEPLK